MHLETFEHAWLPVVVVENPYAESVAPGLSLNQIENSLVYNRAAK